MYIQPYTYTHRSYACSDRIPPMSARFTHRFSLCVFLRWSEHDSEQIIAQLRNIKCPAAERIRIFEIKIEFDGNDGELHVRASYGEDSSGDKRVKGEREWERVITLIQIHTHTSKEVAVKQFKTPDVHSVNRLIPQHCYFSREEKLPVIFQWFISYCVCLGCVRERRASHSWKSWRHLMWNEQACRHIQLSFFFFFFFFFF